VKSENGDPMVLVIYVHNIIIIGSKAKAIAKVKYNPWVKYNPCLTFDMTDLSLLHYCLGVEV
jgi:hypothetical protein